MQPCRSIINRRLLAAIACFETNVPVIEAVKALRKGLAQWIQYYNFERGHSSLDDRTPDEVYYGLPHPSVYAI